MRVVAGRGVPILEISRSYAPVLFTSIVSQARLLPVVALLALGRWDAGAGGGC